MGATTVHTQLCCENGGGAYDRTSYVINNILPFLRFSRNDYYSICLDYYISSDFEQIKNTTYASPSYVVFYLTI